MAPTRSKPLLAEPLLGTRKRILATSLADPNNVDAAAIKRRRLEEAAAVRRLRQPSIETVDDDEDNPTTLVQHPRKASNILEATDGSDDDETSEFGRDGSSVGDVSMPGLTEEEGESVDGEEKDEDDSEPEDEDTELGKQYYS
jgi:hypothetical protein